MIIFYRDRLFEVTQKNIQNSKVSYHFSLCANRVENEEPQNQIYFRIS